MTARYEYAVLLSHASEATIPGLVIPVEGSAVLASEEALRAARAVGVRALVVRRAPDGEWRTRTGRTPAEALQDGSDSGWRGWLR